MEYTIIRSKRKTIGIQITPDKQVLVRCPINAKEAQIRQLVEHKEGWIRKQINAMTPPLQPFSHGEIAQLTEQANAWFPKRVAYWAEQMGLHFGRITLRHQRTCWGSCSSKGNLNFNCVLMLAPEEVADYVIVHELCHLVQPNHSKAFWALVESAMPDYAAHRRWLKENSRRLIGRIS